MGRKSYTYTGVTASMAASGGSASVNIQVDNGRTLYVEKVLLLPVLDGAFSGAITGTPLPRDPSATAANNTMPTWGHVLARISVNNEKWQDNDTPLALLGSTADEPAVRFTSPVVNGGQQVQFTFTNNGPAPIKCYVALEGYIE